MFYTFNRFIFNNHKSIGCHPSSQVPKNYSYTEKFFGISLLRQLSLPLLHNILQSRTMYERKIPVDLECPLRLTMSLIDSKWKSCILDELRHRTLRPSELHKIFPEATPRVLDLQLKELVEDGLVSKTIYPELPPRSEYSITPLGMTLIPLIDAMIEWGNQHKELFEKKYGK